MIKIIILALLFSQIKEINPQNELKIKIQTTKEDNYYLLTKEQPVEVKVEGPTWLRVYSRIPWSGDAKGTKIYKIILQENELAEKFITNETERSKVAKLGKNRLSKWRSFYINVPEGLNTYRLILWRSPADTVLIKFAYESPGKWSDIMPSEYNAKLELVEDEKVINYYELTETGKVILETSGPKKIKVISRLNYGTEMQGEQLYSIAVREKSKVIKSNSFRTYRSETTSYRNRTEIVPSNPHSFYLNVGKGKHRLEFYLTGAGTGVLRFMVQEK